MKQTFEELIGICAYSQDCSDMIEVIPKQEVIKLLKQVKEATIQECINLQKSGFLENVNGYSFRKEFRDLDKDSIEI